MNYTLTVNNQIFQVESEPDTPLLWILRDFLQLTGTKFGCGVASCGACTVHLNGVPVRSCSLPIEAAVGKSVTTIEGVESKTAKAVQAAWVEHDVVQCGYCQSGQIMSAIGLLEKNSQPTDDQIEAAMSGNVCRCVTYGRIKEALKAAADAIDA